MVEIIEEQWSVRIRYLALGEDIVRYCDPEMVEGLASVLREVLVKAGVSVRKPRWNVDLHPNKRTADMLRDEGWPPRGGYTTPFKAIDGKVFSPDSCHYTGDYTKL